MHSLWPEFLYVDVNVDLATALPGEYDWKLVVLSIMIATLAAYAALGGADRIAAAGTKPAKYFWLGTGATAMGVGIWAMHFIGMLAFTLPVAVGYDVVVTVVSIIPAILASAVVLHLISASKIGLMRLIAGGVLMGTGIGLMHYIGMAAMRADAIIAYDPFLFALSILVAIGLSVVALYTKFAAETQGRSLRFWARRGSSLVKVATTSALDYIRKRFAFLLPNGDYPSLKANLRHYDKMQAIISSARRLLDGFMNRAIAYFFSPESIGASNTNVFATFGSQSLAHWSKWGTALIMGLAVACMHYTGMAAANFFPGDGSNAASGALNPALLSAMVAVASVMVIGLAILIIVVDRRMEAAGALFMANAPTKNAGKTVRSVSRSFNFAMISVVSILIFCFATAAIVITIKLTEAELEQKLTNTINFAKSSLGHALWNLDNKIVEDFNNAILLDDSFVYAGLFWDKQVITERKHASVKDLSVKEIERSSDFITKSATMLFEEKDVGRFVVAVSRDSINLKIILNALGTLALAIFVIAGVSATSLFVTRKYISLPLLQLHQSASKIAQGDLDAPIQVKRQDEFGILAQNFDDMRGSIKTLVGELRESNRTLEQRVEERTSEAAESTRAAEEARGRLVDALESTHEGFLLCDADDRVVLANQRFLEMYRGIADIITPGTPYQRVIRALVDRGLVGANQQDPESWFEQRLSFHRSPKGAHLYQLQDGRWVQVTERKTDAGGTVSVYSDITELKESEQRASKANHLITQSLRYASRIQAAILPARDEMASATTDHFLLWEPRDIVGGDFFWFQKLPNGYALIVGDCTGHGVPGAFMTLVAWGLLDRMFQEAPDNKPSQVLSGLHKGVQALLGQDRDDGKTDDGLEAGICFVNTSTNELFFSGARFSLWHSNGEETTEIRGDRASLGYRRYPPDTKFADITVRIGNESAFYMTTDGVIDQIGGPRRRSFGRKRFQAFIEENFGRPMEAQSANLVNTLEKYQGDEVRRDDLTVLGFVP